MMEDFARAAHKAKFPCEGDEGRAKTRDGDCLIRPDSFALIRLEGAKPEQSLKAWLEKLGGGVHVVERFVVGEDCNRDLPAVGMKRCPYYCLPEGEAPRPCLPNNTGGETTPPPIKAATPTEPGAPKADECATTAHRISTGRALWQSVWHRLPTSADEARTLR